MIFKAKKQWLDKAAYPKGHIQFESYKKNYWI